MLWEEIFSIEPSDSRGWQWRVVPILLGTALWMVALWPGVSPAREPAADPKSQAAAALKSGEALLEEGELEKALAAFSQSVRLRPQDARAYYSRACVYKRQGEPDKAAADLAQAIRLDPGAGWAYFDRGWAYGRSRHVDKAIADMTERIRLCPDDFRSRVKRGTMFFLKGDHDKAVADLTEAIRLSPENPSFLVSRALAYEEKGDLDKAIADNTEAIRLEAKYAEAYADLGHALCEKGEYDKAIAALTEAIHLDPKDAEAFFVRGYACAKKRRADKAASDFAAAARLDTHRGEPKLDYLISWPGDVKDFLLFCHLPVYEALGDAGLREDLGLSPAQEKRLREVAAKAEAERLKFEDSLSKLPQKEQDAKRDEVYTWEDLQKANEPWRKQVEGILTRRQLDAFKKRVIAQQLFFMLAEPASFARSVGADREQTKKLQRLSDGIDRRLGGEMEQQNRKLLAALDARQREVLRTRSSTNSAGSAPSGSASPLTPARSWARAPLAGSGVVTISGGTLAGGAGGETKTSAGTTSAAGPAADAGEAAEGGSLCLYVYGPLLDKAVRDRLGMSKAQQKKLLEIATKCQADQEKRSGAATKFLGVFMMEDEAFDQRRGPSAEQGRPQANRGPSDARPDGGPEGILTSANKFPRR